MMMVMMMMMLLSLMMMIHNNDDQMIDCLVTSDDRLRMMTVMMTIICWLYTAHVRQLQSDAVVEVWKSSEWHELSAVTAAGLKAVLASPWYLSAISIGVDWVKYYNVDPLYFNGEYAHNFVPCFVITAYLLTNMKL